MTVFYKVDSEKNVFCYKEVKGVLENAQLVAGELLTEKEVSLYQPKRGHSLNLVRMDIKTSQTHKTFGVRFQNQ